MSTKIFYQAAKETLVEYFQKTSLNGFGLLYYIRRRKYQRIFWFFFIILGITFAVYVCTTTLISFLKDPTVTALDPQIHSVYSVPFPSVAVCSNNKYSRQAIRDYAVNISQRSWRHNLPAYWEYKLEQFAGLLNPDSIDFDEALQLHNELESLLGKPFNTLETIEMLSPKCEDLIVKCFWAGERLNCTEHFQLKTFFDGGCCVFNYQYKKPVNEVFYPNATGPNMGLILILNSTTADYFYAEENTIGFNIKLFGTQRIPDTSMGEMEEFHVCPGEDVNVKLNLVSQHTTEDVRAYSVAKRGCYFPYEHKEAAFDRSECLLKCKIQSIEALCDCVPFYSSEKELEFTHQDEVKEQCSLAHVECLERYTVTWQTYFPSNADTNSHLKDELMDSLQCPDCYPLCSYNRYYYRKTVNGLKHTFRQPFYRQYLGNISHLPAEISLVKIYYPYERSTRYQKNLLYNWYQILSNIGGVIGICMGCSIISGIEIIYFVCYRLMENYIKLKKSKK